LHEVPDTRDNFAKQVAQLQLGDNPIGDVQKQSQAGLRKSVVHCHGDLISNHGQELLILVGVCVVKVAGKNQASQLCAVLNGRAHSDRSRLPRSHSVLNAIAIKKDPIDHLGPLCYPDLECLKDRVSVPINGLPIEGAPNPMLCIDVVYP
jgi:hypothetical protein